MTYRRMLYLRYYIKRNHFIMYIFCVVGETHAHDYFEVISFYNILRYVIPRILRHMCIICISKKLGNISKTKQGNQSPPRLTSTT